jgi:hypothetical protein
MIKKAVVTDETPCVDDSTSKKEFTFFDGEKVATKDNSKLVKLSKILDNNNNELENTKSIYR